MKFIPTRIPEVILIEPSIFRDERGFFLEDYRKDLFAQNGIHVDFVQDNHALSKKGALRGLHYQTAPKEQAKLVRVVRGEVFDVVVDVRPGSKTFGQYVSQFLNDNNKNILFVPVGFAHGYLTLSDEVDFFYKASNFYSPQHECTLRWDDPALGIPWPKTGASILLSEKDKKASLLKDLK